VIINVRKAALSFLVIMLTFCCDTRFTEAQHNTTQKQYPSRYDQKQTAQLISSYTYNVVNIFPHDDKAFTQGLVFDEGILYEGTGLNGSSSLHAINLGTGKVLKELKLPSRFFGEGITVFGNNLIQLTWRSGTGLIYDKKNFNLLGEFHYETEGWGITHDGRSLIMSDGSANIYFLDPVTYEMTGQIEVTDNNGQVNRLNELEYVRGQIYANVWQTDSIVIIDPGTGRVKGRIDLAKLVNLARGDRVMKTLNGIAYDKETDRLFVTGKLWPNIYEIRIIPVTAQH